MRKWTTTRYRTAVGLVLGLALAGCAGQSVTLGDSKPQSPDTAMAGRWILAAPGAPTCGMNFTGAGAGKVSPEGGCPGNFYLSRTWALEQDALVINDDENNPLARLSFADGRYEGQSVAGLSVTLTRQPVLAVPAN